MKVLVTGAGGFVARNLIAALGERGGVEVLPFTRGDGEAVLRQHVAQADFVFHLAGVNRPESIEEFKAGNTDLTRLLCDTLSAEGRLIPVVYSSSTQALTDNPYGASKRAAEELLQQFSAKHGVPVYLFRLPNVFGKWARPNYNSAVATFCHNIARGLPIQIHDPAAMMQLVYIDDVVAHFIQAMNDQAAGSPFIEVDPVYRISVGGLAEQLQAFRNSRANLIMDAVGTGLIRALYATYVSYLPPESFAYEVPKHEDRRGVFVEMLKTRDSGQFSFLTAHPGVTRGGHYHHSKTEKFLVIKGQARFRFRHIIDGSYHELTTSGDSPVIVETVPGWTHDITNIGSDEMVVMLWANEIFDHARPDTFACPV
ncbi:NAD-dependent epimerase/dehydratase family protein [Pollutimonas sp. H1-120]|uniref:UDP-2-acetamido-2,6-beta-L-arabino-hexul-4-ose reductase n=1 Tax=Pollutimonas sp. H1-120 TaxID=3148824 RepID=UPI003B5225B3